MHVESLLRWFARPAERPASTAAFRSAYRQSTTRKRGPRHPESSAHFGSRGATSRCLGVFGQVRIADRSAKMIEVIDRGGRGLVQAERRSWFVARQSEKARVAVVAEAYLKGRKGCYD